MSEYSRTYHHVEVNCVRILRDAAFDAVMTHAAKKAYLQRQW